MTDTLNQIEKIEAIIDSCTLFRLTAEAKAINGLLDELRRISPAAAVPEGALPPLPTSQIYVRVWESTKEPGESLQLASQPYFTDEQIQAYARAAVEADRAQQGEPVVVRCEKCGADRLCEPCGNLQDCGMIGTALATKAAAPADAELLELAQQALAASDARQGDPDAPMKAAHAFFPADEFDRAAPAPDTGIPTAGEVEKAEPHTYMTDEQAEKWAWEQVKRDVGTEGWTVGDNCNYYGFFLWGWRYRKQYESQRAAPSHPSEAQTCTCPSGDGSLRWPCPVHPSEAKAGRDA